jgi:hypothetical protein
MTSLLAVAYLLGVASFTFTLSALHLQGEIEEKDIPTWGLVLFIVLWPLGMVAGSVAVLVAAARDARENRFKSNRKGV